MNTNQNTFCPIATLILARMQELGYNTPQEFALATDLNLATITTLMKGQEAASEVFKPNLQLLVRLSYALVCPFAELFMALSTEQFSVAA